MSPLPRSSRYAYHLCDGARLLVRQRDRLAEVVDGIRAEQPAPDAECSTFYNAEPDVADLVLMAAWQHWGRLVERHCRSCVECLSAQQAWLP